MNDTVLFPVVNFTKITATNCVDAVNNAITSTSHNFNLYSTMHLAFLVAAFIGVTFYHTRIKDLIFKNKSDKFKANYNRLFSFLIEAGVIFALATALDILNRFNVK